MLESPTLYIVIPCYNEEVVLPETSGIFLSALRDLVAESLVSPDSRIMFVNDGSSDHTWNVISELSSLNNEIEGISLSRNRGHQNALLAGLMTAKKLCDVSISIDCDGQDDASVMRDMVLKYKSGFDIVYGVRDNRDTDTFFKRATAQGFYRLMSFMGVETVYNHADYRLMSKRALEALSQFHEVNLFLRGMIPLIGYPSAVVKYGRHERMAGESHYPLSKMINLAVDGITSLSIKPIRLVTALGLIFLISSLAGVIWSLVVSLSGSSVPGWTSVMCVLFLVGGAQMFGLGVVGEYIGKLYLESKARPRYIISEGTSDDLI